MFDLTHDPLRELREFATLHCEALQNAALLLGCKPTLRRTQALLDDISEAPRLTNRIRRELAALAQVISPANWLIGSKTSRWITYVARRITRRPKARSSAGTRPSRTASCWKTTICRAIFDSRSTPSSITTTTNAITRACRTSRLPMSTSAAARQS